MIPALDSELGALAPAGCERRRGILATALYSLTQAERRRDLRNKVEATLSPVTDTDCAAVDDTMIC